MRNSFLAVIFALTTLTVTPGFSWADGAEQHDGFYLRMHLGPGYTSVSADDDKKTKLSGSGAGFGVSIGGMVVENFGIFGVISDTVASNPELEFDGETYDTKKDVSAGIVGLGAGVVYYVMPVNLYVSGALMADEFSIQEDGDEIAHSDKGLGLELMVGKEWWASDNWGLGVAGALRFTSVSEDSTNWTGKGFNVVFSATYN